MDWRRFSDECALCTLYRMIELVEHDATVFEQGRDLTRLALLIKATWQDFRLFVSA